MKRRLAVFVACACLSACGGATSTPSTPTTPSQTTAFQGTVAGSAGQNGTLTVTVQTTVAASLASSFHFPFVATLHAQTTSTVTATGNLTLTGGSNIPLTGTFNTSTKALSLSGSGFTFTGTFSGGLLSGTYTGPNNAEGAFSSVVVGSTPSPTSVTGRWVGKTPDGLVIEPGPGACTLETDLQLDLTSSGTTVTGTATLVERKVAAGCSSGAETSTLTNGTVGSGTISFSLPAGPGRTLDFSGTFTNTRMTGRMVTFGSRRGSFAVNRQ